MDNPQQDNPDAAPSTEAGPPGPIAAPRGSAITVARLATDAARAKRLADLLAEHLDEASAVACYEDGPDWCVEIQFAEPADQAALTRRIADLLGEEAAALRFETLAPRDWVGTSLAGLSPVAAGRFVVHGAHDRGRIALNRLAIEIEASLAFGTGHHGTTRGCLLALDRLFKAKKRQPRRPRPARHTSDLHRPGHARPLRAQRARGPVAHGPVARGPAALDIGTGSGVLAIAAAKMLRGRVLASDIDPTAVRIAGENAHRNGVTRLVEVLRAAGLRSGRIRQRGPYPLVVANILLGPLKELAAPLVPHLAPRAEVILSGLLAAQADAALAAYRAQGLRLRQRIMLDGWAILILTGSRPRPTRR